MATCYVRPNITGRVGVGESQAESLQGAFYGWEDGKTGGRTATNSGSDPTAKFSAQKSNARYNGSTFHVPSVRGLSIIKI